MVGTRLSRLTRDYNYKWHLFLRWKRVANRIICFVCAGVESACECQVFILMCPPFKVRGSLAVEVGAVVAITFAKARCLRALPCGGRSATSATRSACKTRQRAARAPRPNTARSSLKGHNKPASRMRLFRSASSLTCPILCATRRRRARDAGTSPGKSSNWKNSHDDATHLLQKVVFIVLISTVATVDKSIGRSRTRNPTFENTSAQQTPPIQSAACWQGRYQIRVLAR